MYKVTARFEGMKEPFVDWFRVVDEPAARLAWAVEAKACGVPDQLIATAQLTIEKKD
jgi:hypothetical protein